MRLFVALNLPAPERRRVHDAARPLREEGLPVRWVPPENYHLTLKFLGQVRPERQEEVVRTVDRIAADNRRFTVPLGGFGAFPTIRRPRVVWLGVEPTPALRCLKQDIEWALADCGFERETRAFHPHLTLGRVDREGGAGAFRGLDELTAGMSWEGSFDAESLDLMRSRTSSSGATYSVVRSSPLGSAS